MSNIKIGCAVKGRYKIQVLENCRIIEDRPWADNMILNQGLDYAIGGSFQNVGSLFRYHCVGTGTSAVSATDTGLESESKRTGTLLTGDGNVGRTVSGDTATFRYTFDHAVEGVGGANYTEHGISPYSSIGNNLFARSLISGGTVTVAEGQQLRVVYDVSVTVSPATQTAMTVGGTGWPVSGVTDCTGYAILGDWDYIVGSLGTNGNSGWFCILTFANPNGTGNPMKVCSTLTLNTNVGSSPSFSSISDSEITFYPGSYTNGTFTRKYEPSDYASPSAWNSSNIEGWCLSTHWHAYPAFAFKYNHPQTKANTHRLRYPSVTITWARA